MNQKKEQSAIPRKGNAVRMMLGLLLVGTAIATLAAQGTALAQAGKEKAMSPTQSQFYCNTKALTPEERTHHKQLTDKLLAVRKETVEMPKGYEFQFSPQNVTLAELADWVAAESKCCPFFDFHIDLEKEGKLICLRLTGEEGIKGFLRSEFQIPAK